MDVNGEELRLYKQQKKRRRVYTRVVTIALACLLLFVLFYVLFAFYFVVRDVSIEGSERYTKEELLNAAGIMYKDNLFMISENDVEAGIKEAFPYIKSVTVDKEYPDSVTLILEEEYTVFAYEMLGEYFLFNRDLRLMERFTSMEALVAVRSAIVVEMPMPKSCIVPQYIQLQEECGYVSEMIAAISDSPLVAIVSKIDLTDKFVIQMELGGEITVEFGDFTMAEEKLFSLYKLIGDQSENLTGHIDITDYPSCFYKLTQKNAS